MTLILSWFRLKYPVILNVISLIFIIYSILSCSIFLYLNWNYVIEPTSSPYYNGGAAFGDGPAKFEFFGAFTPLNLLSFTLILHFISLLLLIIKNKLIALYPIILIGLIVLFYELFHPIFHSDYGTFVMFMVYLFLGFLWIPLINIILIIIYSIENKFKKHIEFLSIALINTILFAFILWMDVYLFFD